MHIVARMVSVVAVCCFVMTSVVAADGEKKLLASQQVVYEDGFEIHKLDIRNIERVAENGFFLLRDIRRVKGFHTTLYQVFDGEKPIGNDLYVLTHAASYLYPYWGNRILWMGRYYFEPAVNGIVETEHGPQHLYIETFPVNAIEEGMSDCDGRVIGTANDGSTKLHVVWRIGKSAVFSSIEMPKKTSACEQLMAAVFKLFMPKK